MYESFFSLEDAPFVLTPDPRYLLRSKVHHEILSSLLYGITSQKGLMALIGDVGTGKTTLCRALLRELPTTVQSALVLNPHLSEVELVGTILDDLGLERAGQTVGELMTVLSNYLLVAGGEGKTVLVVLDEAQQMSVQSLEQIRILSNLETPTRKLLQILLVGQPELEEKLRRRELRQLEQRIGIRCYLQPLSKKETFRYIEHRLRVAGLHGALPFTRAAMIRIFRYSRGIPRLINLVCDRALMAGFSVRAREIGPAMVTLAIRNLRGSRRRRRANFVEAVAATLLIGVGVAGTLAAAYWTGWSVPGVGSGTAAKPAAPELPKAVAAPVVTAAPRPAPPPPVVPASAPTVDTSAVDADRRPLAELLKLWGVRGDLSPASVAAWPVADGNVDVATIAGRYQLDATFLPETSLAELRAIALPALIAVQDGDRRQWHLLRRIQDDAIVLVNGTGRETRHTPQALEPVWGHAAWIVWWNVDRLPENPNQDLTVTITTTVARRLQSLGHLRPPLPQGSDGRFQFAVRRFQRETGLPEDGILGPRTTLTLSRVVAGKFAPTIVEASAQ